MNIEILGLVLTFLGGGALATILTFVLDIRKQGRVNQTTFVNDIYKELSRQNAIIEKQQLEINQLREEKKMTDEEKLTLKEENMKLRLEMEDLKRDYEEIKLVNEELRRKIDILLKK